MFTGPVGPVEVFFYWPEAVSGNFYWPGAIGSPLASSPESFHKETPIVQLCGVFEFGYLNFTCRHLPNPNPFIFRFSFPIDYYTY